MTIQDGDIKFLLSENLTDADEGGGMATANALADGLSNGLFAPISNLASTYGNVSLRKVFAGVVTDTVDTYYGMNVMVAAPPVDSSISVCLFSTGSYSDTRAAAKSALESYLTAGAESRYRLYGNHLSGQRTIAFWCRSDTPDPAINDVYELINNSDATVYQYVRVLRVVSRTTTPFEDGNGIFSRDVITVEISSPLENPFPQVPVTRYDSTTVTSHPTRIHATVAADAAVYYGVSGLTDAAAIGDLSFTVDSIYTQLVPAALSESPITDARCVSDRSVIVPISGAAALTFSSALTVAAGGSVTRYFGRAIARNSVSVSVSGVTLTDDGNGNINAASSFTGSVDYEAGSVTIISASALSNISANFAASPAAVVTQAGHSDKTDITALNRGYTYVKSLSPVPAPGSVNISYRAQSQWYTLKDDGAGNVSGVSGTGVGLVNYATGAVTLTLGALPDVDTAIIYGWGSPAHYDALAVSAAFSLPLMPVTVDGGAIEPSSLSLTYLAGGVTKTVTDNGAGLLQGAGTGYIDYARGYIALRPMVLPDSSSDIQVSCKRGMKTTESAAIGGGVNAITLGHPVLPGSLSMSFADDVGIKYSVADNGQGALVVRSVDASGIAKNTGSIAGFSSASNGISVSSTTVSGNVNYSTGAVSISASSVIHQYAQQSTGIGSTQSWQSSPANTTPTGTASISYRVATDSAGSVETHSYSMPPLEIDLLPSVSNAFVPGSLSFTLGGHIYVDRAGVLTMDPAAATNVGTAAGTVDAASGKATLTQWAGGSSPALNVLALTQKGLWSDSALYFRTSGAPIQSASLYVAVQRADNGQVISATANASGVVSGNGITGQVDINTGVVSLAFPTPILPATAKYNAVTTSSIPLSAEILGLDPVRLPVDGRVPIFRKGEVVVVHHTVLHAAQTVSSGQTVSVGRTRLARLRVIDAGGNTVNSGLTVDLDAGTVKFTSISGLAQPVRIEDRIEDARVLSDVQINGELTVGRPLSHDFPADALVSSALIVNDQYAHVSNFFDQATWSGWADALVGSAATATYNKTQYPVVVTNRGAIDERWEIVFTNTTTFNVIGESVGQIVTGQSITNDCTPTNPAQGVPYFTLKALGFGSGWAAGNVIRFNTHAANAPVWCVRTALQGATTGGDQFTLAARGDVIA